MKKIQPTSIHKMTLHRETVRRLAVADLTAVAGGVTARCNPTTICTHPCLTE
jgi:hypothetical protein